jgi:alanine racemase
MNAHDLTWIEINKQNFEHNIALYKSIIGEQVQLGIVVKANGYGHGLDQIITLAQHNNSISWFFVSHLSEALTIRARGCSNPILIMSSIITGYEQACLHNIDLMADNKELLTAINKAGASCNKKVNVHLKVDTGLSRFGSLFKDFPALFQYAQQLPFIHLRGIYTHFAESNNSDLEFTQQQAMLFEEIVQKYAHAIELRHMSNTAAISAMSHNCINLVRLGAGAYGLWPSEATRTVTTTEYPFAQLKPLLTWKTRIIGLKEIPEGSFVGYNRTHFTTRPTTIAVLPVGYYDGYDKRLSNKGMVRIKDRYAPIIGLVGMNNTTIDVSHIRPLNIGDEVLLLGNHPLIHAYDLANQTGCFNTRQMLTQINPLIKRIIVEEPKK